MRDLDCVTGVLRLNEGLLAGNKLANMLEMETILCSLFCGTYLHIVRRSLERRSCSSRVIYLEGKPPKNISSKHRFFLKSSRGKESGEENF